MISVGEHKEKVEASDNWRQWQFWWIFPRMIVGVLGNLTEKPMDSLFRYRATAVYLCNIRVSSRPHSPLSRRPTIAASRLPKLPYLLTRDVCQPDSHRCPSVSLASTRPGQWHPSLSVPRRFSVPSNTHSPSELRPAFAMFLCFSQLLHFHA